MSLDISLYIDADTGGESPRRITLFDTNITHNVRPMWEKAGVYDALYESDGNLAEQYIPALAAGVADMATNPADYEALDSANGWGTYRDAFPWLHEVYRQFLANPKARIGVSR